VLGLCLFSGADSMGLPGYRSVMRWLTDGRRHLDGLVLPARPGAGQGAAAAGIAAS
jgi:hypothetical protein